MEAAALVDWGGFGCSCRRSHLELRCGALERVCVCPSPVNRSGWLWGRGAGEEELR